MIPHFFKAHSRLGIRNLALGQKDSAFGVEDAPSAILTKQFLNKIKKFSLSEFFFTSPEKSNANNYFDLVLRENLRFKDQLVQELKPNEMQIVVGGDHSVTFPSLLFDIEKHGRGVGVIHFDSHADFNHLDGSPSKNFHGMYLRIFFDNFDIPNFDKTVPNKLPISNLLFIGDLELDSEEKLIFEKLNPNVLSSTNMLVQKKYTTKKVKKFARSFDHIHISFDVDVFEKDLVSATTTPSKNGFKKNEVFEILEIIKNSAKSLSLDLCEVNPRKIGADKTIRMAQEILLQMLAPRN